MTALKNIRLGDLQLAIMQILWARGEATVADVHAGLSDRELAPTTVATMLKKMEKKGVVTHRVDGRAFVYQPTISENQVIEDMVSDLAERHFDGQLGALVSHLLHRGEIDSSELDDLKAAIEEAAKREEDES